MFNLRRLYNQNRKKVWAIVVIIIFAIAVLRILNYFAKINNEKQKNEQNTIIDVQSSFKEDHTAISDTKINEDTVKQNSDIIDNFFQACNNGDIEQAYNMLTTSCKEIKYPSMNIFKTNYYEAIFKTKKSYNKEAWMEKNGRYTYRIVIIDDPLATGTVNYNNSFQDFYTIVKENGEEKLNISSFVAREELNKSVQADGITINVKYRDCTMNDEQYVFEVTNETDKVVCLDSKEKQNTTYLLGEADNKYPSYSSEMNNTYIISNIDTSMEGEVEGYGQMQNTDELNKDNNITNSIVIPAKTIKQIKVRFNKMYSPTRKITAVEFSDIITDYETYLSLTNKKDYKDRLTMKVEL